LEGILQFSDCGGAPVDSWTRKCCRGISEWQRCN